MFLKILLMHLKPAYILEQKLTVSQILEAEICTQLFQKGIYNDEIQNRMNLIALQMVKMIFLKYQITKSKS